MFPNPYGKLLLKSTLQSINLMSRPCWKPLKGASKPQSQVWSVLSPLALSPYRGLSSLDPYLLHRHLYLLPSSTKEGPFAVPTLELLFIQLPQSSFPPAWPVLICLSSLNLNIIPSSESSPDQVFPAEASEHPNTDDHSVLHWIPLVPSCIYWYLCLSLYTRHLPSAVWFSGVGNQTHLTSYPQHLAHTSTRQRSEGRKGRRREKRMAGKGRIKHIMV